MARWMRLNNLTLSQWITDWGGDAVRRPKLFPPPAFLSNASRLSRLIIFRLRVLFDCPLKLALGDAYTPFAAQRFKLVLHGQAVEDQGCPCLSVLQPLR